MLRPLTLALLRAVPVSVACLACGAEPPRVPLGPPVPPAVSPSHEPRAASAATVPQFENPGGLFMPEQMPGQAETLARLGLKVEPALLADPLSTLLSSIVPPSEGWQTSGWGEVSTNGPLGPLATATPTHCVFVLGLAAV